MADQSSRPGLGSRVRNLAAYVSGIRSCAVALQKGRKPSRQSIIDAGFEPDAFDQFHRF